MAKFNDKISSLINSQLPDFVVDDHPQFVQFLKTYYQFMESAMLQVTSIENTDGITLENETGLTDNLLLDGSKITSERTQSDAGDKIIYEDTVFGKFTIGETITGLVSKATATVLAEDLANNKIYISAQDKFSKDEVITGNISGAKAIINNYNPNPVNTIQDLTNFRDPDKVISNFLTNFRDEFLKTIPETLALGLDKRNLIKNIKSMYQLKGTQAGHELFFRILFNQVSETFYPRTQMLRVSDGQWDTQKVLRAITTVGDSTNLVGRTITGSSSAATAIVESVKKFVIGNKEVSEFILNINSMTGTFVINEELSGTNSDTDGFFIKATITGIPGTKTITNDGNLYATGDFLTVSGGGVGADIAISDIGSGPVSEIIVDNSGTGYSVGDKLVFDNTGTKGVNAEGFVSVVNGGISGESGTGAEHILMEDETGRGDQYSGSKIVMEGATNSDLNDITDIFLINKGSGYETLPKVTITSSGTNANILAHGTDIGRVIGLKTNELGEGYQNSPSPTIKFRNCLLLTNKSGNFNANDTITGAISGATGTLSSYDADRSLLKVKDLNTNFILNETITSTSSGSATIARLDVASATVDVVSIADTDGKFLNEDGNISEQTMKVQDSLYYQDFSYVLKVGQSINDWRDSFKKTMHTSGFYFTGQVELQSRLSLKVKAPVAGIVSGAIDTPLFNVLNVLFTTVFGRRLGTVDDGTSLRSDNMTEGLMDAGDDYRDPFTTNTRDITLTRPPIEISMTSRKRAVIDGVEVKQGYAYAGPKFGTLNKHANTIFGVTSGASKITFKVLNEIKIQGTRTSLDGRGAIFLATSNPDGQLLKTNFAMPTQFAASQDLFDNTVANFAQTTLSFDDTTP
nr:putative structural protein [uncultured Mediterranean phage uvMED]